MGPHRTIPGGYPIERVGKPLAVWLDSSHGAICGSISGSEMLVAFEQGSMVQGFARQLFDWQLSLNHANSYGLFRVRTISLIEIVVLIRQSRPAACQAVPLHWSQGADAGWPRDSTASFCGAYDCAPGFEAFPMLFLYARGN